MKPETKARILAQYVGCLDVNIDKLFYFDVDEVSNGETYVLPIQLKSIDNITEEDAKLLGASSADEFRFIFYYDEYYEELRQLGYATPHTVIEDGKVINYSVEQLVEEGLFKII